MAPDADGKFKGIYISKELPWLGKKPIDPCEYCGKLPQSCTNDEEASWCPNIAEDVVKAKSKPVDDS